MHKTILSQTNTGDYVLSRSIDNKLWNVPIDKSLSVDILYSYYKMNDEQFKQLCKLNKKYK